MATAAQSSSAPKICAELTSATVGYLLSQVNYISGSLCPGRCLSNNVLSETNTSAMTSEANEENKPGGRCLLGNWVEEVRFALRV